ncbi:MAG: helix-turn-helix domain-containing protein [Pigmentiphaga sp.]|nr:helix-turn-helix domain-containing protein [Pigmentiphaga sp.]
MMPTIPADSPLQDARGSQAFHLFAQGRPADRVFQTITASQVPAHARYEYWTSSLIRNFVVDPPDENQRRDFQAHVISLTTFTKEMHYSQSDAFSGVRTAQAIRADPSDELSLFYVLEGQLAGRFETEDIIATAGSFYLYDSRLIQRIAVSRHRLIQVDLPRCAFEAAFAGQPPSPAEVTRALALSRLTPLLRSHLAQFPQTAAGMNPLEQQTLLETTEAFALSILRGAIANLLPSGDHHERALLLAAQRYIQRHLDKPDLAPAEIAAGVACSRATLYRVFKRHGLAIAAYVRELRLQQLFRLLQNPSDHRPIATLAQRCGLYDTPNVNQMFRRRFGASPSDVRAQRLR